MELVKYLGIQQLKSKGIHRDYVSVQYENGDQISIPVGRFGYCPNMFSSDGKHQT